MDNDLSVLLKVILDSSGIGSGDISKIQKILEKYTVNVAAELDKTQLMNSVKQVLPQVIKEISKISGKDIKIDIDDSLIEKSINQVIQDGKRLEKEFAQKVDKIQLSLDTGETESKVESLITKTRQWTDMNGEARISTQSLTEAFRQLNIASNNYVNSPTEEYQKELILTQKELDKQIKTVTSSVKTMNAEFAKDSAIDSLRQKYQKFYNDNSKAHGQFGKQLKDSIAELSHGAEIPIQRYEKLKQEIINIGNICEKTGRTGQTVIQGIINKVKSLSTYVSGTVIIAKLLQTGKEMINFARELDEAMTNINYTMDVSSEKLSNIGEQSIETAKNLKTSAENILAAVTTYANANETAESILSKSKPTIMLSNVTGMDTATTTDILQGTIHQFDLKDTEEELYHVSDVLQAVSKSMAVDFSKGIKEMAEGIQVSGSVANDAGYDLERYSAILGNLIEKTRQSGSELGRSLRTMFVRTTKASTSALAGGEVSEDDLSNAETALRRVGIEVRDTKDTFRDFDDIMSDLYNKIDDLSEVDLSNIAYEIASTRQTAVFKVMVKTWGDYLKLSEQAYAASGETLTNQEKYVESLRGKFEGLKATAQSIYSNLAKSEDVGAVVDGFQAIADAIDFLTDKLGLFGTIGLGGSIFLGRDRSKQRFYPLWV